MVLETLELNKECSLGGAEESKSPWKISKKDFPGSREKDRMRVSPGPLWVLACGEVLGRVPASNGQMRGVLRRARPKSGSQSL